MSDYAILKEKIEDARDEVLSDAKNTNWEKGFLYALAYVLNLIDRFEDTVEPQVTQEHTNGMNV